jgi:hypothetical protein
VTSALAAASASLQGRIEFVHPTPIARSNSGRPSPMSDEKDRPCTRSAVATGSAVSSRVLASRRLNRDTNNGALHARGVTVRAVMTDNGSCFTAHAYSKRSPQPRLETPPDQARQAASQRQSRATDPNTPQRVGLRSHPWQLRRTNLSPRRLPRPLQLPTIPTAASAASCRASGRCGHG